MREISHNTRAVIDNGPNNRAPWERASETLRTRVKALAEANGLSVTSLGIKMGYSRGGLRNALASEDGPKLSVLLKMAAHLQLRSIEELFGEFGTTAAIDELRPSVEEKSE